MELALLPTLAARLPPCKRQKTGRPPSRQPSGHTVFAAWLR